MADPRNLKANGNSNNSTPDDRVIWEDGQWAIIEAGDCWDGLARSKTRDNLGDAVTAPWDPGMTVMPGKQSITARKLVKVKLADLLASPVQPSGTVPQPTGRKPQPGDFKTPPGTPVAPPSPFLPKPWAAKDIPEFPEVCRICSGRIYRGLNKVVHEATEHGALAGECPGSQQAQAAASRPVRRRP